MIKKLFISSFLVLTLVGCEERSTEEVVDSDNNQTEDVSQEDESTEEENSQNEQEDEDPYRDIESFVVSNDPVNLEEVHEDLTNFILHTVRVDKNDDTQEVISFFKVQNNTLSIGYSDFDEETFSPVLSSEDFDTSVEEETINSLDISEDSIIIKTDNHTYTFTSSVNNELTDDKGYTYELYNLGS